jgi:hypothetical protein
VDVDLVEGANDRGFKVAFPVEHKGLVGEAANGLGIMRSPLFPISKRNDWRETGNSKFSRQRKL